MHTAAEEEENLSGMTTRNYVCVNASADLCRRAEGMVKSAWKRENGLALKQTN